jgi:hypothetical protein
MPQWSPPVIGGSTLVALAGHAVVPKAAMEPAGYRREHPTLPDGYDTWGFAAMEPAGYRREHPGSCPGSALVSHAAMEPAGYRREHLLGVVPEAVDHVAAMEPAGYRREHGSQDLSLLTCAKSTACERFGKSGTRISSMDLSRCKKQLLTCMRALPSGGVTTSALAAQMMTAPDEGSLSW